MRNINPFEREPHETPLLRILVHTDSFISSNNTINLDKLILLSQFEFLQVNFTPTQDERVNKKFEEDKIKPIQFLTRFAQDRNQFLTSITIFTGDDSYISTLIRAHKKQYELDSPVIMNSKILLKDLYAADSDQFDFFIVSESDDILKSKFKSGKELNFNDAFKLIRIILVNNRYYYVVPRYKIDEGYYYLFRFKKVFINFQNAWTTVLNLEENIGDSKLINQFDSLSQRLNFICRAIDKLSFEALKNANNDTQDNILYHFGYYIMLVTGVFDDIAWILNFLYKLNLNRMDVVLKETRKCAFHTKLKHHNHELYEFLTRDDIQNHIGLFYPLRDTLQHRRFIKGMAYKDMSNRKRNIFNFPKQIVEILSKLSADRSLKDFGLVDQYGEKYYFDVYIFSNKSFEIVSMLVNNILDLIDWGNIISELPKHKIDEIEKSKKAYETGVHNFLGFAVKPLYFEY